MIVLCRVSVVFSAQGLSALWLKQTTLLVNTCTCMRNAHAGTSNYDLGGLLQPKRSQALSRNHNTDPA